MPDLLNPEYLLRETILKDPSHAQAVEQLIILLIAKKDLISAEEILVSCSVHLDNNILIYLNDKIRLHQNKLHQVAESIKSNPQFYKTEIRGLKQAVELFKKLDDEQNLIKYSRLLISNDFNNETLLHELALSLTGEETLSEKIWLLEHLAYINPECKKYYHELLKD